MHFPFTFILSTKKGSTRPIARHEISNPASVWLYRRSSWWYTSIPFSFSLCQSSPLLTLKHVDLLNLPFFSSQSPTRIQCSLPIGFTRFTRISDRNIAETLSWGRIWLRRLRLSPYSSGFSLWWPLVSTHSTVSSELERWDCLNSECGAHWLKDRNGIRPVKAYGMWPFMRLGSSSHSIRLRACPNLPTPRNL